MEDKATNRKILTSQAQSWGMTTLAATFGSEAGSWLIQGEACYCGLRCGDRTKLRKHQRDLGFAAMLRYSDEYLKTGRDDYIPKPIQLKTLVRALSKCQSLPGTLEVPSVEILLRLAAEAVIDPEALQALREGVDKDAAAVMVEVIERYQEDTPHLWQALCAAVAPDDAQSQQYAAHTLNSSMATQGATMR